MSPDNLSMYRSEERPVRHLESRKRGALRLSEDSFKEGVVTVSGTAAGLGERWGKKRRSDRDNGVSEAVGTHA